MLEQLIRELVQKRTDMEQSVFSSPPTDWFAFQRRLGAHIEINELIEELHDRMKGLENDSAR